MKRILVAATLMICSGFALAGSALASITHYSFPVNIALRLEKTAAKHVEAVVEARIGTLSDVKLFFESSADVSVEPASTAIERLSAGRPEKFRLKITPTGRPTDASGSWIRLRAVYRPDYANLARTVADPKKYPDESERQRLLDIVARNRASGAAYTDAARLDLENEPGRSR